MKKKIILISILLVSIVVVLLIDVLWLASIFLLLVIYILLFEVKKSNYSQRPENRKEFSCPFFFLILFGVSIIVRLFLFEVFDIPSESMEKTLLTGDKVLISKLHYGALLFDPTNSQFLNSLAFYFIKETSKNGENTGWQPCRLKGFSDLKRNDVLVFKNASVWEGYFIKRCVALPGDVFQIKDSELYIDAKYAAYNNFKDVVKRQIAYATSIHKLDLLVDSLNIFYLPSYYRFGEKCRQIHATEVEIELMRLTGVVDSFKLDIQPYELVPYVYPQNVLLNWTVDNYGPLRVPYKGMIVSLNDTTAAIYAGSIINHEKASFENDSGTFKVNGITCTSYRFTKDYCFMLGDHFYNSQDSRFWGFQPVDQVVGKATRVLWSYRHGRMRWNRILKKIK